MLELDDIERAALECGVEGGLAPSGDDAQLAEQRQPALVVARVRPQRDTAVHPRLGDERSASERLSGLRARFRADGGGGRIPEQLEEQREGSSQAQPQRVRLRRLDRVDDPAEEELASLRTVGELTRDGLGVNGLAGLARGRGVEEGVRPQLHDQIERAGLLDAHREVAVDRAAARIDGDQARVAEHGRRCGLADHALAHDPALTVRSGLVWRKQRRNRSPGGSGRRRRGSPGAAFGGVLTASGRAAGVLAVGGRAFAVAGDAGGEQQAAGRRHARAQHGASAVRGGGGLVGAVHAALSAVPGACAGWHGATRLGEWHAGPGRP